MRARENPFRTDRLERLLFRQGEARVDDLCLRLAAQHDRGAIVGPHGSGKTRLLRELAPRLEARGLRVTAWFANAETRLPSSRELARAATRLGPRDALLFDGAGHLGPWAWRRLHAAARDAGAFVVTTHAPGRLPTWVETSTDRALLQRLTHELVGDAAPGMAPLLDALFVEHAGNLRDVFLSLYDLAAREDTRLRGVAPAPSAG